MTSQWMLYGATGYTGQLIAQEAVAAGHKPILAGRNELKLRALAMRLHLPYMAVALEDLPGLRKAVQQVPLVVHAAGPFVRTHGPMVEACLAEGAHYLDITGEIPVFQSVLARDLDAKNRGVLLMSGAGFDVVPTDCLAVHVAQKVEHPTSLKIAVAAIGAPSAGTAKSAIGVAHMGTMVLKDGKLKRVPFGKQADSFRFSDRERWAIAAPLGDLCTAPRSTGIQNIETYLSLPSKWVKAMNWTWPVSEAFHPVLKRLLQSPALQKRAEAWVEKSVPGATKNQLAQGKTFVFAEAASGSQKAHAWLETLEGYTLTAKAVVLAVETVMKDQPKGALTPAQALGKDFILRLPKTQRWDELP